MGLRGPYLHINHPSDSYIGALKKSNNTRSSKTQNTVSVHIICCPLVKKGNWITHTFLRRNKTRMTTKMAMKASVIGNKFDLG